MNLSRLYDFRRIYNNIDKYDNKIMANMRNLNVHLYKINNSRWGVHKDNKDIPYEDLEKHGKDIISYPLSDQLHQYIKDNVCFKYGYWRKNLSKDEYLSTYEIYKFLGRTHCRVSNLITRHADKLKNLGNLIYQESHDTTAKKFALIRTYFLNERQLIYMFFVSGDTNHTVQSEIDEQLNEFKIILSKNYKNENFNSIEYIRSYVL